MGENKISFSNKQLFKLVLPLVVEQFLAILVGFADSIMVSTVGESAISAVSLVDTINVLLFGAFVALATGGAVVAGQYIGQRKFNQANETADQLLIFITILSMVITIALFVFRPIILHGLFGKIDDDVMAYSNTYYLIVEASVPFMALYNVGAALFRIMGNSSVSMMVSILMNLINVVGNAICIFGLHYEVEGVAIPTLISRIIAAIIILLLLRDQKRKLHFSKPFVFKLNGMLIKIILKIGVPNGVENSLFQLGKVMLLSVVSAFSTSSIAANSVGNTIATFQVTAASAVGFGMVTVVSQCVGAKDFDGARYYTRKLLKAAYLVTLISNVIIFLLLPIVIKLYGLSEETSRLAEIILWIHGGFSIFLWPASFTLPQTLKAAGDTTYTMIVAIISMWTFRIAFGILFAKYLGFGVIGIWMAMMIDWVFRIIFFVVRYKGHKWQEKYVR